jgi:hypothetical protein
VRLRSTLGPGDIDGRNVPLKHGQWAALRFRPVDEFEVENGFVASIVGRSGASVRSVSSGDSNIPPSLPMRVKRWPGRTSCS